MLQWNEDAKITISEQKKIWLFLLMENLIESCAANSAETCQSQYKI